MRTEIVGQVADPEVQEFDPIIVPIAAYTAAGEEVIEEFAFRPVMPAGAMIRAFRSIQPNGVLATGPILDFLTKSLMSHVEHDELDDDGEPVVTNDRERFLEFIDREDLMLEMQLITDVYQTVTQVWSDRPTRRPSGSASGGSPTKRTSQAGVRSKASASKTRSSLPR